MKYDSVLSLYAKNVMKDVLVWLKSLAQTKGRQGRIELYRAALAMRS